MTLTELRAMQHNDLRLQSDEARDAYLNGLNPRAIRRDLIAHMSPVERRMLARAGGKSA